jgi:hypothetical protein
MADLIIENITGALQDLKGVHGKEMGLIRKLFTSSTNKNLMRQTATIKEI